MSLAGLLAPGVSFERLPKLACLLILNKHDAQWHDAQRLNRSQWRGPLRFRTGFPAGKSIMASHASNMCESTARKALLRLEAGYMGAQPLRQMWPTGGLRLWSDEVRYGFALNLRR